MELLLKGCPHSLEMLILILKQIINCGFVHIHLWKISDISPAGVDIYDVRIHCVKLRAAEHGILPVLTVLRLIEAGLDSVVQQKNRKHIYHIVCSGTAQHCNLLFDESWLFR